MLDHSEDDWLAVCQNVTKTLWVRSRLGKTFTEGGGESVSVSNILWGSGAGVVTLWGGDLGFVSGNVQESGGGAHGFPHTGDGKDGQLAEGWYLDKRSSGECNQRRVNADVGEKKLQTVGNSDGVGVIEAYT